MFNKIKNMNKMFELKNNDSYIVKLGRFSYISLGRAKKSFQSDLDNWWSF